MQRSYENRNRIRICLQNVVKDSEVQRMLSNTLEADQSKHQAAIYEPKMTRAKMKQVLEREGNVSYILVTVSVCCGPTVGL